MIEAVNNNRIVWVDIFRGICVFCVLLAHSGCCPVLYLKIYTPFFLSGFFFLSGYCYRQRIYCESLKRLFLKLIVPYFVLSLILIILSIRNIKGILSNDYSFLLLDLKHLLLGKPLWFVSCLCVTQFLFINLLSILKNKIKYLIPFAMLSWIVAFMLKNPINIRFDEYIPKFWYWDTSFLGLGFFILGYVTKKIGFLEKVDSLKAIKYIIFVLPLYLSCILSSFFLNVEFHVMTNYYQSFLYYIIAALSGILLFVLFSHFSKSDYLIKLGQNSLLLFAISGKVHQILDIFHFAKLESFMTSYLYCIFFCVIQGYIILRISKYVNKYAPFIVGK